jgi:hypothetical protein
MRKKYVRNHVEDYHFTTRLGICFLIGLVVLVMAGNLKRNEPGQIVSETSIVEAKEVQQEVLPSPAPVLSQKEKVLKEIEDIFGDQAELAKHVAFCESSLIPRNHSKTSSAKGLFMIIDSTWRQFKCSGDPLNYVDNIKCAKKIYDHYDSFGTSGGWKASQKCWNN